MNIFVKGVLIVSLPWAHLTPFINLTHVLSIYVRITTSVVVSIAEKVHIQIQCRSFTEMLP